MDGQHGAAKRILLITTPSSYRTAAFAAAAERLGLEVVKGVDLPHELAEQWKVKLAFDLRQPAEAVAAVVSFAAATPVDAIVAVDDSGALVAADATAALGLPCNAPEAALAARDKLVMRQRLTAGGVPVPQFQAFAAADDPASVATQVGYPCVVKPTRLSGSRGVIRADDPAELAAAFTRVGRLLAREGYDPERATILVERFIPGVEVALEGLLTGGELRVLALFDKPDPLDGPFFEETIYVTPSRLPAAAQAAVAAMAARAAAAIGLREGPVHAELRVNDAGPWIVVLAGRTIGGLCSTILQFGTGISLEEIVLRHAAGLPLPPLARERAAVGVMMIPIPQAGILRGVCGVEEAQAAPGVVGVEITARLNNRLVPLPEGGSYLGFIFARGGDPAAVEAALRTAHAKLRFEIRKELPVVVLPGG
ncbi:MAG: ATP-grasp domain-containing protein [Chloroflexi bacterium]|nr:ATP-grasp domain-containing protein [Chloroflexota bacterium]